MVDKSDQEYIEYNLKEDKKMEKYFQALAAMIGITRSNLLKEVKEFYSDYGSDGVVTYQEAVKYVETGSGKRSKRLLVLFAAVSDDFSYLAERLDAKFYFDLHELITDKLEFLEDELSQEDIDKLLKIKWGVDSAIWSTRLQNNVKKYMLTIENEIKVHITAQRNIKELEETINKKFDTFENVIERLFATEVTVASTHTQWYVAKKNGYKYYYWVIKPDACDTCIGTAGTFPIDAYQIGVTAPPLHPHCRCIIRFIKSKKDKKV